jgi:hypothetical protein
VGKILVLDTLSRADSLKHVERYRISNKTLRALFVSFELKARVFSGSLCLYKNAPKPNKIS